MARTSRNSPGSQLPLWGYCGVCGGLHYDLGPDMFGRRREHKHCGKAIDRWIVDRPEPLPEAWVAAVERGDAPNRAAL